MAKRSWILVFILIFAALGCKAKNIRSADPCEWWTEFQNGEDEVGVPIIKSGNASHGLSPAEIIYYSCIENAANPVLILTYLEGAQKLLSEGKEYGDFEMRLYHACGYGSADESLQGFYPEVIATAFWFLLMKDSAGTFEENYVEFPAGVLSYAEASALYADFVTKMNTINQERKMVFPTDLTSKSYGDFIGYIGPEEIQQFLEEMGSPLKEENLFREKPVAGSELDYQNPPCSQ